jgi:hypothetical protein
MVLFFDIKPFLESLLFIIYAVSSSVNASSLPATMTVIWWNLLTQTKAKQNAPEISCDLI